MSYIVIIILQSQTILKLRICRPKLLLLMLLLPTIRLPAGPAGDTAGPPTGRVEGQLAESDYLVVAWPGVLTMAWSGCDKVVDQPKTETIYGMY